MRNLSPAIVALSVCGACMLAELTGKYRKMKMPAIIILSACNMFVLFQDVFVPVNPLNVKPAQWINVAVGVFDKDDNIQEIFIRTCDLPKNSRILSSSVYYHAVLAMCKGYDEKNLRMVPYWSPEVVFLFNKGMTFENGALKLRNKGINYVMLPDKKDYIAYITTVRLNFIK